MYYQVHPWPAASLNQAGDITQPFPSLNGLSFVPNKFPPPKRAFRQKRRRARLRPLSSTPPTTGRIDGQHGSSEPESRFAPMLGHQNSQEMAGSPRPHAAKNSLGSQSSWGEAQGPFDRSQSDIDLYLLEGSREEYRQLPRVVREVAAHVDRSEEVEAYLLSRFGDVDERLRGLETSHIGLSDRFNSLSVANKYLQHDARIVEVEKQIATSRMIHDKDQERLRNNFHDLCDKYTELQDQVKSQKEELAAIKRSVGKIDTEISKCDRKRPSTGIESGLESPESYDDFIIRWIGSALHDEIHRSDVFITSHDYFSISRKWIPETDRQSNHTCLELPYVRQVIGSVMNTIARATRGNEVDHKDKASMFELLLWRLNFEIMLAHRWLDRENLPSSQTDFDQDLSVWMERLKLARDKQRRRGTTLST